MTRPRLLPGLLLPGLLLFACGDPGASSETSTADTGRPWWEEPATDADGDGLTWADGDCDDGNPAVHPGVSVDACDGIDEDCDGEVDEDFADDAWEPDDTTASDLGPLAEEEQVLAWGWIFPASDLDRYTVDVVDDDWTWFSLEAWLYDVPADADYALEIHWVEDPAGRDRGVVASADLVGLGGNEVADWGGDPSEDCSGRYEIRVRSVTGAGCAFPYTLQVILGGW